MSRLPATFVWTKMGAESGEALARIIRRKEFERQLGSGLFAWGIGNALGSCVAALATRTSEPMVVFSPMPSKAKKEDASPSSVMLWTGYEDACGTPHPLPAHLVITSRGRYGQSGKERHYALFCRSSTPLEGADRNMDYVEPRALRNLTTGNGLGASQVTAVVRRAEDVTDEGRRYPVAFTANLAEAMYVRLLAPQVLSDIEVAEMATAAEGGFETWSQFVRLMREPA